MKTLRTDKITLVLLEEHILRIESPDGTFVDLEDIKRIQPLKKELVGDDPHFVLIISPHFGDLSKEAREYAASDEANQNAVAKAIVVKNLGMRIFSNLFIQMNKPPVPHRAFTSEAEAIRWLKQQPIHRMKKRELLMI